MIFMEEKVFLKDSEGNKIVAILNKKNSEKIVILVHGYRTSKDRGTIVLLRNYLKDKDFSYIVVDLYGHGESDGVLNKCTVETAVNSIRTILNYVINLGYSKIGLVGSSYGGNASLYIASESDKITCLVLKSPVSFYPEKFLQELKEEKAGHTEEFYTYAKKHPMQNLFSKISCPTLIFHGNKDTDVPYEQSVKASSLIPNCKLETLDGEEHIYSDKIFPVVFEKTYIF